MSNYLHMSGIETKPVPEAHAIHGIIGIHTVPFTCDATLEGLELHNRVAKVLGKVFRKDTRIESGEIIETRVNLKITKQTPTNGDVLVEVSEWREDAAEWARWGIHTAQDWDKSQQWALYSDLYKDRHGIRPSNNWRNLSLAQIDTLIAELPPYEGEQKS